MAVHFVLMIYIGIKACYIAEKSSKYRDTNTLVAKIHRWNEAGLFGLIFFIIAVVVYPECFNTTGMDKAKFNRCVQALAGLKVAEEMYIGDNNKYIGQKDVEKLGMYMIPGCTNPNGCGTSVRDRVLNNCKDFEVKIPADGQDYQIIGTAMDRTNCCICVNSKGISQEYYKNCPSCPAQCPK